MPLTDWTVLSRLLDEALNQPPERRLGWVEQLPDEPAGIKEES